MHAKLDFREYLPEPHLLHFVPPWFASVSVTEPAWHFLQLLLPIIGANRPRKHALHVFLLREAKRPFIQGVHDSDPGTLMWPS